MGTVIRTHRTDVVVVGARAAGAATAMFVARAGVDVTGPWRLGHTRGMPIRIVPARLDWLTALVESDAVFAERFGVQVEPGWIGFPEALPFAVDAARDHDADPWGSHLFFDDDGALVGFGGFKGPPSAGRVEIGYAVAPSRQGRGIATAATRWMVDRARDAGVEAVVAHTLAEVNASTAVLERCGFVHVDTTADPDGDVTEDVYRWELLLSSAEPAQS